LLGFAFGQAEKTFCGALAGLRGVHDPMAHFSRRRIFLGAPDALPALGWC